MEYWYHGTNEFFTSWRQPPIQSKYKPNFFPHSFISFSQDIQLAQQTGGTAKGLCRATVIDSAKVLDLRISNNDSEQHWEKVRNTEHGKVHKLIQTFEDFSKACINGEILRMHTNDTDTHKEPYSRLHELQRILHHPSFNAHDKAKAHLTIQNFTREWVETVLSPANEHGYDAVICAEIDRYRPTGPVACTNLSVFNPTILSKPDWVSVPDESLMQSYMQQIRQLGLDKVHR